MKTMAIFYSGCIEFEIMLACEMLNSKYSVSVITPEGDDHTGSNGMVFKSSGSFESVNLSEYKIILVPGGDPGILIGNTKLNHLIQQANANGAILGAICAGPVVLEQAGVLKGRKIAHGYKGSQLQFLNDNGFFKNTILTEEAFIVEDNIVTARPDSFIDFAVEIAGLAGSIPESQIPFWKEYYRGHPKH
jgi:4-methyl-5(b-hydroxyethyl)-thiazole monophosphate biosynthesis